MKILLQAIKSLLRKVENTAERVLNFFSGDGIIKQEHLPDGYPYGKIVEILPSITIGSESSSMMPIFTPFTLIPDNEYIVTWNGVEYVCVAHGDYRDGVLSGVVLGNIGAITGENMTEEPFIVQSYAAEQNGAYGVAISIDGSQSATISIIGDKIVKMDTRYLPDEVALKSDLEGLGGGISFETDETLYFHDGVLGVNTAHEPDPDNTLPITSAAVAQTVGNINAILKTI